MDATQVMDGGDDVPKGAHAVKYPDQSVSAADIDGVAHSCCGDNMRTERSGCVGTHGVKVRDRSKCEYVLSEGHSIDRLSLSELGCAGMVEGGEGGGSEAVAPTDVGGCPRGCLDCHDVGSKGIGSDDVGSKARLIKGREDVGSQDFGILDVGGGRGDLAVNICMNMPQVRKVCVIDVNNKSLDAGRARVASLAPSQDVIFECASVEEHQRVSELLGDCARKVVIGLHCCGGLSDAVLNIAVDSDWPFLVCPCKCPHCHAPALRVTLLTTHVESSSCGEQLLWKAALLTVISNVCSFLMDCT